jgi:hypothetical protein
MRIVAVPTYIIDEINQKLDAAFRECPEAAKDRDVLYQQLLDYVDEHGVIPDFSLTKKEASCSA